MVNYNNCGTDVIQIHQKIIIISSIYQRYLSRLLTDQSPILYSSVRVALVDYIASRIKAQDIITHRRSPDEYRVDSWDVRKFNG